MPYTPKQVRLFQAIKHGMKPKKGGPSKATASRMLKEVGGKATRAPIDDSGKQLDNSPVIFHRKPVAQARKRVGKAR